MLLQVLLGVCAGVVTGLVPGVHVNLVTAVVLSLGVGPRWAPFIVSLAVTHTFLDTIPAVLLGAPEAATALGVLPGHRYVLRGQGYMAIKLTLVGSLLGLLLAVALLPMWWQAIRLYGFLSRIMGWVLLGVSGYMILRDRRSWWSLLVFGLSGALGYLLLNGPVLAEPLFPLFSGLFGLSTLLYSLRSTSRLPAQAIREDIQVRWRDAIRALLAGNVSGFLTSMLPGLGAAQAAVLGMKLAPRVGDHGFLVLLGSISTVNFSLSLLTWLALDKARNGAVVALGQLVRPETVLVVSLGAVALIAAGLATALGLFLARRAVHLINRVPYRALSVGIIVLIIALVAALSGWRGLFVLGVSTAVGLIPAVVRCSRAHAMGCLMLPVALFFL